MIVKGDFASSLLRICSLPLHGREEAFPTLLKEIPLYLF